MNHKQQADTEVTLGALSRRDFVSLAGKSSLALGMAGSLDILATSHSEAQRTMAPSRASNISGSLTIVHEGSADIVQTVQGVINQFQQQYPQVKVISKTIAGGGTAGNWAQYSDALIIQIAGGQIPDVVWMATEGLRVFASKGLLEPLDKYIQRDKAELAEYFRDLPPIVFGTWDKLVSPDGHRYQLPTEYNTVGIWYNVKLFHDAGVSEPASDWTWNDFLKAAHKLTKPGKVYGMQVSNAYFNGIMPWLLTNGASTMNATWTRATVNSPRAIEAARFMRSLVAQGISPQIGGQFDPFHAMAEGQLAMFGAGWWPLSTMRGYGVLNEVKIAPWPRKTAQGSPVGWNMFPIFKASHNKEAAWAFAKFMTSKQASQYVSSRGLTLPFRKSVAESHGILDTGPKGGNYLYKALSYSTPIPSPDKNAVIQQDIEDTFGQILAGNIDSAKALSALNTRIQSNL